MPQPSHQCTRPTLLKRKRTYTDDEENDPGLYERIQIIWPTSTNGVPEAMLSPDSVASSELCEAEPVPSSGQLTPMDSEGGPITNQFRMGPLSERLSPLPILSWADPREVWELMCHKDEMSMGLRDGDVFQRHPFLTARMRSILLDWLIEVCEVYKLHRETYHLTMDFIDRYLTNQSDIPKQQLQLIGITCLFIASKVEEIYPPKITEFAYVTDGACTEREILDKELVILKTLNWNLSPITANSWLCMYLQLCSSVPTEGEVDTFVLPHFSRQAFAQIAQLLDLGMLDDGSLRFPYSVLAASSLFHMCSRDLALFVSGLQWSDIATCVQWLSAFAITLREEGLVQTEVHDLTSWDDSGSSGLLKLVPRIIVDDTHNIQTHTVDLKLLERAQQRLIHICIQRDECIQGEEYIQSDECAQDEVCDQGEVSSSSPAIGFLTPPSSSKKVSDHQSTNTSNFT